MNKLWVFGDSFSATNKLNNLESWRLKYKNWKGYTPLVWGDFLSLKIQHRLINCAIGGIDNYTIFETILDVIDSIKENDIVFIGWSSTLRFRLVGKNNSFVTIRPNNFNLDTVSFSQSTLTNTEEFENISLKTITELLINRDNALFQYEVNRFIKIINLYLNNKCKVIHWSPFQFINNNMNIIKIECIKDLEKISDETNGYINDGHYSENGHKILSEYFYDLISKK